MRVARVLLLSTLAFLVSACSAFMQKERLIGKTRQDVIAVMGTPDIERTVDRQRRLEFIEGPSGHETHFFILDRSGIVTHWEQVLTEENFQRILPSMRQADVELLMGPSRNHQTLARNRGVVWSYRYATPLCRWFQVEFDIEGVVRSAGYGFPPECQKDDFFKHF